MRSIWLLSRNDTNTSVTIPGSLLPSLVGLPGDLADRACDKIASVTFEYGTETHRQCKSNKKKSCACQGDGGASYSFGCNWILQRPGLNEKYLVVVKEHYKHFCDYTWVVAAIISWDSLPRDLADKAYDEISSITYKLGKETHRQCKRNRKKSFSCQGDAGASYSFGCSWTRLGNLCKFADQDPKMLENSS